MTPGNHYPPHTQPDKKSREAPTELRDGAFGEKGEFLVPYYMLCGGSCHQESFPCEPLRVAGNPLDSWEGAVGCLSEM